MSEAFTTSSIDASWPPRPSSQNRIRGFYPAIARTDRDLSDLVDAFNQGVDAVTSESTDVSRVTIRAVMNGDMLRHMDQIYGIQPEAALPLYRGVYGGKYICYIAYNSAGRSAGADVLVRHSTVLDDALNRYKDRATSLDSLDPLYTPRLVSSEQAATRAIYDKLCELYGAFGLNEQDVDEVISSETNTIALLEDTNGNIVSTVLVETAAIPIEAEEHLVISEVTEAVTHPEHMGRGLYTHLSRYLVETTLADEHSMVSATNALYGESNLSSVGVIYAAAKNRRRFNFHDRTRLGVTNPVFGILQQNFKVNDGVETRDYNDFAVSYYEL